MISHCLGTIILRPDEYNIHGNYEVEVTAVNLVTAKQTSTITASIYHPILNASVELSQPLLLHPDDSIDFTVYILEGSQLTFTFSCTDGYQVIQITIISTMCK